MNPFISLVKTQLNLNFGISALKYRFFKEKKKRWEPILIIVAIIAGIGPVISMYSLLTYGIFIVGKSMGQPELAITIPFVFGQLVVLVFGIFYVLGTFYFAKDINILVPLPLKPYEVLASKFIVIMTNEYLTLLPILLPPVIIFGVGTSQNIIYWIKGLFIILASPAIPLVLAMLFNMIIMRFINLKKNKDILTIIGGIIGIILILGLNFFIQRIVQDNPERILRNFLESRIGLIEAIGRNFPPSIWATLGLAKQGFEGVYYIVLFLGVSAFMIMLMLWLGNIVYYRSLLSGQEVGRGKRNNLIKKKSSKSYENMYKKGLSPTWAVFLREWKLLLRTPVYALNGLVGTIMGPFILFFMFFVQTQTEGRKEISAFLHDPSYSLHVALIGLGIMLFTAGLNVVASTSISREGSTFWISKMIPVSPREQIMGKYLNAFSVSLIGVVATAAALLIFLEFSLIRVGILIVLGMLGSVPMVSLSLLIDVLHPKLEWNNPQEAIKQNMNGVLGMAASFLVIGALALPSVAMVAFRIPEWAFYLLLAIIMIILAIPSLIMLFSISEMKYGKIEV